MTNREKDQLLAAGGGQLEMIKEGELLEAPEMAAMWKTVEISGQRMGDDHHIVPGSPVVVDPEVLPAVLLEWKAGNTASHQWLSLTGQLHEEDDGPGAKQGLWEQLQLAREDKYAKCTVMVPTNNEGPEHWALFQLDRSITDP